MESACMADSLIKIIRKLMTGQFKQALRAAKSDPCYSFAKIPEYIAKYWRSKHICCIMHMLN